MKQWTCRCVGHIVCWSFAANFIIASQFQSFQELSWLTMCSQHVFRALLQLASTRGHRQFLGHANHAQTFWSMLGRSSFSSLQALPILWKSGHTERTPLAFGGSVLVGVEPFDAAIIQRMQDRITRCRPGKCDLHRLTRAASNRYGVCRDSRQSTFFSP